MVVVCAEFFVGGAFAEIVVDCRLQHFEVGSVDVVFVAADTYKGVSRKDYEFDCLLNALNGTIILSDKSRADSILNLSCLSGL